MKKGISIILILALVLGSFSYAFAAVQDVSDATTHNKLTSINTLLNDIKGALSGTNGVLSYIQTISSNLTNLKNAFNSTTYSSTTFSNQTFFGMMKIITDSVTNCSIKLTTIIGLLDGSGSSGIATILSNILSELTWTDAGQNVIHGVRFIVDRINTIRTNTTNIASDTTTIKSNLADTMVEILLDLPLIQSNTYDTKTNTGNIYTLENNYLPGIYAYSSSIDGHQANIDTITAVQLPKLEDLKKGLTNYLYNRSFSTGITSEEYRLMAHNGLADQILNDKWTGRYYLAEINGNGSYNETWAIWQYGSPLGNIAMILRKFNKNFCEAFTRNWITGLTNYNSIQTKTNWKTLANETFTPSSAIDGIYKWFGSIQTPIARLASVHASDEEIQAREYAANNQAAVTNNFINPSGNGSVPTSSFGSISGLSSGVKNNITTSASPSGIFDIFNSNHGSWFSQETANQLDTTVQQRGSSFDTPLLDQKIDDLYDALGEKK